MNEKLDEFKYVFKTRMIKQINDCGIPPAKYWPVPKFMRKDANIMKALLGRSIFDMYCNMSDEEQDKAIDYVENCGTELCEMLNCQLFDEWNKEKIVITDNKKIELREKYNIDI